MILVSVIVCTFNRNQYIGRCLEHLHLQDADKASYEVIIINNNSSDNTESICNDLITRYPDTNFRYFVEQNQGLSYARNRGIQEAKANILAFLDDDAFATPGYIESITKIFEQDTFIDAVGGKIIPLYELTQPAWMSHYLLPLVAAQDYGATTKKFPKGKFPIGANMIFKRSVFVTYGLFDIRLGRKGNDLGAGEEKELFEKLVTAGAYIVYDPSIIVEHIIPENRTTVSYIKRMGIGVGKSERLRIQHKGLYAIVRKILSECVKSVASLLLMLGYFIIGRFAAGKMLVQFRIWVIKGLLQPL